MKFKLIIFTSYCFAFLNLVSETQIEEIVTTGSFLKSANEDYSFIETINKESLDDMNLLTIGEISKYISSSTGSQFQTNTLDGTDQGMSSITLRGLDNASTLILINSKKQTSAGTTSNEGEGYVDINIIPQIALKEIQILKEGASTAYGSDAIAGVVNFLTYEDYEGYKLTLNRQETSNYNQSDSFIGILIGKKYQNSNLVLAFDYLDRNPLNASEITGIAELGLSTLGNSFKLSADDEVFNGLYQGSYLQNQWVADPNCENNGGILSGSFCKFLYGERFNITNTEEHKKSYFSFVNENPDYKSKTTFIYSDIAVKDNPQSPSYPALSFLSRKIQPGIGGSPFNVPVTWYGRPLGSAYPSPNSPKDISQYHLSQVIDFILNAKSDLQVSISSSKHKNSHNRPDTIDSRFEDALNGNGGPNGNLTWNIFDISNHDPILIDYISGSEKSKRIGEQLVLDAILNTRLWEMEAAFGMQLSKDKISIKYDEASSASFDTNGFLIEAADLLFLGGGKSIAGSRNKKAVFSEINKSFNKNLDFRLAARYEKVGTSSSFDPKVSLKYKPINNLTLRASFGSSFVAPSMAQLFASEILLGTIRGTSFSDKARVIQIGNPNLKPATAINSNIGLILSLNNYSNISLDYWQIDYKNRIELENGSVKALEDPDGDDIIRNSEGFIIGVHTTFFNENKTEVSGFDISYDFLYDFERIGSLQYKIQGTSFIDYLTPEKDSDLMINRVGYYNFSSNVGSIPKYKINSFISLTKAKTKYSFITRYVSSYKNQTPVSSSHQAMGYTNKVDDSFMTDFSIERSFKMNVSDVIFKINIENIFDGKAPRLYNPPDFSFDPNVHDPRGRLINFKLELNF